ncbi:FAD-dependent oxidoreductase [Nocardia takedensis]|uniref:FAD-dependent oxidoreductase n=1 Tax=Nocardia takedensis TaxID=259390 RepID=UPI0006864DA2|nr:FAD-dependent oxidoreductase [Nocardia takedensis]
MSERTRCVVVGGGPAGIVLGLLLARAGVEVTVLEKHTDFLRDFRGDTVHPSTLRLLDDLGLGARFAALPISRLEQMRVRIGSSTVVMADFRRIPGPHKYLAMVPQWEFLDLLARAAAEEPAFTLRTGCAVTGLLRAEDGRVTGVRYRDADDTARELTADLTVGCDGRWSVVRRAADLPVICFDIPMDVWQIRIPKTHAAYSGEVVGCFGRGRVAVTMDRGDYFQTAYLIEKGSDTARRAQPLADLRADLAELLRLPGGTTEYPRSWDEVKLLRTEMNRLRRWYADGLLCLGDAAHTMSPVGGVGVNLAIQDAVAAARILAEPLRRGRVRTADLARVQRRRAWPTAVTQRSQLGEHDMLLRPALARTLDEDRLPVPVRALRRVPMLRGVSAYLGGIGVRPERAPDFARRPEPDTVSDS